MLHTFFNVSVKLFVLKVKMTLILLA